MSINTNVLNFYIEHNLINAVSAVLKDSSIEESDHINIVNGIYSHYNSISSESLKNSLLQMYVKHEFYSVVLKILEQDGTTYSNIDSICTAINEYGSEDFRNRVKEDFLDYSNLSNNDFISSNLERAAYIYLNSDLEDVCNLIIDNPSFINKVISCYKYSKHYEWLNYIISHNNTMAYKLWINGISFDDDQLKSINLLASTDDSDNPFYYVNFIRDLRINPIDQYVKCSCSAIIKPFIESNIQINSTSYSVIDSSCNDTLFDLLFRDSVQFTIQNYSSSLLRKVNDFGLTHIFSYLKSNDKISNDVLEYLLNRSDCNANIKTLALCSFTVDDLTPGLKSSNYSLYLEIFRTVLYNDFLYGALSNSVVDSDFNSKYCNEVAKCTTSDNLTDVFNYVKNRNLFNILACIIYEKDLESSDYAAIKSIDSEFFKTALRDTIGDTYVARRAYRLLEHDCLDLFDYVVRKCFSDSDCSAFCFSDSHYMYSKYRDYLVSYMNANGNNYKNYSNVNLISILFLKLATNCSSTDSGILNYVDLKFSDVHYSLFKTAISFVGNEQSAIASIVRSHKSDSIFRDDENGVRPDGYNKAGTLLKFIFGEYITSYSSMLNDFIKICDYCYNGLIVRVDGVLNIQYTDNTFIYKLCHNDTGIRVVDNYSNYGIPFGVRSYSCINFANELCDNDSITDDSLISANSLCVIALRILKDKYRSSLPNNVRNYIINNWRLLIPYITECYKKGCDMDGYYILQNLSQSNFRSYVGYETNAHVQAIDQNPISYCYIKYTKKKIADQCCGVNSIAENNLS